MREKIYEEPLKKYNNKKANTYLIKYTLNFQWITIHLVGI
jgi:hypothetical protein